MNRLQRVWVVFFIVGIGLLALDIASQALIEIRGVPAVGVLGGALILLVLSSVLNWLFKEAWTERTKAENER